MPPDRQGIDRQRIDRQWIEAHIPQKGRMCLLDAVLEWDAVQIRTASGTHRAPDHPLAAHGRLGAICGLEYAAQAMALHGALLASRGGAPPDQPPLKGYLASVRGVRLHVARLDDIPTELIAAAERITGNEHTASYELRVSSAGRALVEGRATVVFEAGGLADHSSGHASGRPNASVRP